MGAAIAEGGGEILKFMGDGLLAVFPVEGDPAAICDRALAAAEAAIGETEVLAREAGRRRRGSRCAAAWRCIWATSSSAISARPTRLDFTVIGPAVNMASRLEGLTKELGCSLVASAEFAAALDRRLRPLGRHRLRGIAELAAVYGLDPEQEDLLQELKASA